MLLTNHGPVVAGKTLDDPAHASEGQEETARLLLALRGMETRPQTPERIPNLQQRNPFDF